MTVIAFQGSAGCGKTHRLIEKLAEVLGQYPLRDGQRVLAATYMHGSRRRLDGRLRGLLELNGRYECSTLDSIASRWTGRWHTLAARIVNPLPAPQEFDAVCALTAQLLEFDCVRAWASASFPIMLVDEAQDLTKERVDILKALAPNGLLLVAADEFQCLQEVLRPNPFGEWCAAELEPETLNRIWRTDVADLLGAAAALRAGRNVISGRNLKIETTPSVVLAGTFLANQIGWHARGGTVAILAPSVTQFVTDAVEWARHNTTRHGNGPHHIVWERNEREELAELRQTLDMPERAPIAAVLVAIDALGAPYVRTHLRAWVTMQRNAVGRDEITRREVEDAIEHALANRRRFGRAMGSRLSAMTIHAAKNREFDGIVVVWPYQVAGDDEQKRRLLYNAITRARRWCLILVQSAAIRTSAPFA
jgi:superfamily I DNA/RNA helicase